MVSQANWIYEKGFKDLKSSAFDFTNHIYGGRGILGPKPIGNFYRQPPPQTHTHILYMLSQPKIIQWAITQEVRKKIACLLFEKGLKTRMNTKY